MHPETEARAKELAAAYRSRDRFDAWLRDPRILAQAREDAEREARQTETPARGPQPARRRRR